MVWVPACARMTTITAASCAGTAGLHESPKTTRLLSRAPHTARLPAI